MPIRFRCPHCNRLLGIATRKAGTEIACPQCGVPVTVPRPAANLPVAEELDEIDQLLGSAVGTNGTAPVAAAMKPAAPTRPRAEPAPPPLPPEPAAPLFEIPETEATPTPPAAAKPAAAKRRKTGDSLFETGDVDELLGLPRELPPPEPDEPPPPPRKGGPRPVTGMDVQSIDGGDGTWVLSPQKAAVAVVTLALLLLFAFGAGFLIASRL